MSDEPFTATDASSDDWVDIRMTDPDEGEWDVDAVVANGRVEYVDLRVRSDLFADFVACLADDVGEKRAGEMVRTVAERKGIDLETSDD